MGVEGNPKSNVEAAGIGGAPDEGTEVFRGGRSVDLPLV